VKGGWRDKAVGVGRQQGKRIGLVSLGEIGVGAVVKGEAEEWEHCEGGGDLIAHLGLDGVGPEVAPDVL
jgi:hypothetical protein